MLPHTQKAMNPYIIYNAYHIRIYDVYKILYTVDKDPVNGL